MKIIRNWNLRASGFLIIPALAFPLGAQPVTSLSINGQTGSAKVIQVDGVDYVEVQGFVRIANASIAFQKDQIVMTLTGADANPPAAAPVPMGFSKEFVAAGIEAMAEQREWAAGLKLAIEGGYPLTGAWLAGFRARAQQALLTASVSASADADKDALPFLKNQFDNVSKLSDKYLQMAVSLSYIDPNSLEQDPVYQKIVTCTQSLASMATANRFVDDGSCR
jgi:hypothetical protein